MTLAEEPKRNQVGLSRNQVQEHPCHVNHKDPWIFEAFDIQSI